MEIQEIIRRWQAGDSQRKIALGTGLSRDTIAKYVAAAQDEGIVRDGLVATAEQLSRLATIGQSGPRQAGRPGRTCWSRGRTRFTSGSPVTGCS